MEYQRHTFFDYLMAYQIAAPNRRLLGDSEGWLTVADTLKQVETMACWFERKGIKKGSWVALQMVSNVDAVILFLALEAIGAVAVLTGPYDSVDGFLKSCGTDISPEWVISYVSKKHWLVSKEGINSDLFLGTDIAVHETLTEREIDCCDPGIVIFTSGSTSKSKAVILSQKNLIRNLLDSAPLGDYRMEDVALGALPMHHVFGLALLTGAIVLQHSLYITCGNNLKTVLDSIQEQEITRINGVPALYLKIAQHKQHYNLQTLRVGFIGGGPCTAEQFQRIEEELNMTLIPVYGMSECVGISCASFRDSQKIRSNGVGRFYTSNQGKILLENGTEAQCYQIGEICVNGPMRMIGYHDYLQTAEAIDECGFLHTGDLGYMDPDGILHLTGRKKDIIIRNGVNLSPQKIEEALLIIPGVIDAVVVGLLDHMEGEVPYAMVVSEVSEYEILDCIKRFLAKNEIPKRIYRIDRLPLTSSGKPDKMKIREVLTKWTKV